MSNKPCWLKSVPLVADVIPSWVVSEPDEKVAGCVPVATVVIVTSLDDVNVGCELMSLCMDCCCCVTPIAIIHIINAHIHPFVNIHILHSCTYLGAIDWYSLANI